MKSYLYLLLFVLRIPTAQASHLLGGYVQARSISGLTYECTAVVYAHAGEAASQLSSITLCFGDGTTGTAIRLGYEYLLSDRSISISKYRLVHIYAGPGVYTVTVPLPGRTSTKNGASADNQAFILATSFTTNTITTNQTPTPVFPDSSFRAATGRRLVLSLKAFDSEGDSLVYGLGRPYTNTGPDLCRYQSVTGYAFPNDLTRQGIFTLNNRTGELRWDAPAETGNYSIVLTIDEYRNGLLISQTTQEINAMVERGSAPAGPIPAYVPAVEGTLVTAAEPVTDTDVTVTLFPNPADDWLQVIIRSGNPAPATIQLLSTNGQNVHELVFAKAARQHERFINLSKLAPGVYLLAISSGTRSLLRRVVKK